MLCRRLLGILIALAVLVSPAFGACDEACGQGMKRGGGCCCGHSSTDRSTSADRPGCCEMAPDGLRESPPAVAGRAAGPRNVERAEIVADVPQLGDAHHALVFRSRIHAPEPTKTPPALFLEHCVFRI